MLRTLIAFILLSGLHLLDVEATPRATRIEVSVLDGVDPVSLPAHMRSQQGVLVRHLEREVIRALRASGRVDPQRASASGDRVGVAGPGVEYELTVHVEKADKVFRNEIRARFVEGQSVSELGPSDGGSQYEVVSHPSVAARLDMSLVRSDTRQTIWSTVLDSTGDILHDERLYLYNSWKYPGSSNPEVVRAFQADLMRLQEANRWVERTLGVADRWFLSRPGDDLTAVRVLFRELAQVAVDHVLANLPLEGRITEIVDQQPNHARLDIGSRHGLHLGHRLQVRRPGVQGRQIGEIEIVKIDSVTSVGRLTTLMGSVRTRGESIQVHDVVLSPKRPARRAPDE